MPKVLGVKVNIVSPDNALEKIKFWARRREAKFIVTANPEIINYAFENPDYKAIINSADLVLVDGAGLAWALRKQGHQRVQRFTGVDLIYKLAERGLSIYFLGGARGVARKAALALRKKFPGKTKFVGCRNGGFFSPGNIQKKAGLVRTINRANPDVLLVALGHPKQEMFIKYWQKKLQVGVAIGVGGSFDYISERIKRAPALLRRVGLEWFWRLILQPSRAGRIASAFFLFPWRVFKARGEKRGR